MHCIAGLGKALWTTTVTETDKPRNSNRGGEKTLGLEQFPKKLFLLLLCNVHSRQYDLHEEEEEGTTGCKESDGEGKCKFVKSLKSLVSLKVPVWSFCIVSFSLITIAGNAGRPGERARGAGGGG